LATVSERVVKQEIDSQTMMAQNPETEPRSEPWQFDPTVAARFQKEAALHIPDYQRVIEQCQDVVSWLYPHQRDLALVDVGSALGHTMQQFADLGYTNVWGIEASEAMRAQSQMQDRVLLTDQFDTGQQWQVVLANWTLHFVRDRAQYLASIYKAMAPGGTLIISDKMAHGILEETLYHNWKRSQGVSDDEIKEKQQRLVGVLVPMPLSWYLDTLKTLGFEDIAVINSRFMFHTIYARRG
jgi:SAM-dependent methyltransferase